MEAEHAPLENIVWVPCEISRESGLTIIDCFEHEITDWFRAWFVYTLLMIDWLGGGSTLIWNVHMLSRTKESPTDMFNLSSGDQGGSHLPVKQWCDNKLIISKTTPETRFFRTSVGWTFWMSATHDTKEYESSIKLGYEVDQSIVLWFPSMLPNIMNDNYSLKHGSSALKQWRKSTTFIRFALQALNDTLLQRKCSLLMYE